jgi:hypothetical protein
MGVYELSGAGGLISGRTEYKSMNAGNQYGAMVPIASAVGTGQTTIAFNNIPQTFQDLMLVEYVVFTTNADQCQVSTNISGSVYSSTNLWGNGSSASSARFTGGGAIGSSPGVGNSNAQPLSLIRHFLNYANTATNKTMLQRAAQDLNGSGTTWLTVGLMGGTSAINTINLLSGGYATGSTFTLYGIRAVSS